MIAPTSDRIFIRRAQAKYVIEIVTSDPSDERRKPLQGTIVAIGKGRWTSRGAFLPTTLKVGDEVVFPKYLGFEIDHDGEKFLVLREPDILAVKEA